jgi:hypothetical protein
MDQPFDETLQQNSGRWSRCGRSPRTAEYRKYERGSHPFSTPVPGEECTGARWRYRPRKGRERRLWVKAASKNSKNTDPPGQTTILTHLGLPARVSVSAGRTSHCLSGENFVKQQGGRNPHALALSGSEQYITESWKRAFKIPIPRTSVLAAHYGTISKRPPCQRPCPRPRLR